MATEPAAPSPIEVSYGLGNVYFDKTEITDIDGSAGQLRYRGYSIDELAAAPDYERVAHLLLRGRWPSAAEAAAFHAELASRRALPGRLLPLLADLKDAPPASALRTAVSYLGAIAPADAPPERVALDLVAQLPGMVVAHHCLRRGRPVPMPDPAEDLASDFLRGLLGRDPTDLERRIINLDFVLHADHGANASTFTARVVTSTGADMYAAVSAAVGAFAGQLHAGAVAGVCAMLDEIGTPDAVPGYLAAQRRANRPVMGFGHRIYRRADPRAAHFRAVAHELSARLNSPRLVTIVDALVAAMAPMAKFGIAPNVDLYAAVIYRLLDLSDDLATAIFAAARISGWLSQIIEQSSNNILIRPKLLYHGPQPRPLPATM